MSNSKRPPQDPPQSPKIKDNTGEEKVELKKAASVPLVTPTSPKSIMSPRLIRSASVITSPKAQKNSQRDADLSKIKIGSEEKFFLENIMLNEFRPPVRMNLLTMLLDATTDSWIDLGNVLQEIQDPSKSREDILNFLNPIFANHSVEYDKLYGIVDELFLRNQYKLIRTHLEKNNIIIQNAKDIALKSNPLKYDSELKKKGMTEDEARKELEKKYDLILKYVKGLKHDFITKTLKSMSDTENLLKKFDVIAKKVSGGNLTSAELNDLYVVMAGYAGYTEEGEVKKRVEERKRTQTIVEDTRKKQQERNKWLFESVIKQLIERQDPRLNGLTDKINQAEGILKKFNFDDSKHILDAERVYQAFEILFKKNERQTETKSVIEIYKELEKNRFLKYLLQDYVSEIQIKNAIKILRASLPGNEAIKAALYEIAVSEKENRKDHVVQEPVNVEDTVIEAKVDQAAPESKDSEMTSDSDSDDVKQIETDEKLQAKKVSAPVDWLEQKDETAKYTRFKIKDVIRSYIWPNKTIEKEWRNKWDARLAVLNKNPNVSSAAIQDEFNRFLMLEYIAVRLFFLAEDERYAGKYPAKHEADPQKVMLIRVIENELNQYPGNAEVILDNLKSLWMSQVMVLHGYTIYDRPPTHDEIVHDRIIQQRHREVVYADIYKAFEEYKPTSLEQREQWENLVHEVPSLAKSSSTRSSFKVEIDQLTQQVKEKYSSQIEIWNEANNLAVEGGRLLASLPIEGTSRGHDALLAAVIMLNKAMTENTLQSKKSQLQSLANDLAAVDNRLYQGFVRTLKQFINRIDFIYTLDFDHPEFKAGFDDRVAPITNIVNEFEIKSSQADSKNHIQVQASAEKAASTAIMTELKGPKNWVKDAHSDKYIMAEIHHAVRHVNYKKAKNQELWKNHWKARHAYIVKQNKKITNAEIKMEFKNYLIFTEITTLLLTLADDKNYVQGVSQSKHEAKRDACLRELNGCIARYNAEGPAVLEDVRAIWDKYMPILYTDDVERQLSPVEQDEYLEYLENDSYKKNMYDLNNEEIYRKFTEYELLKSQHPFVRVPSVVNIEDKYADVPPVTTPGADVIVSASAIQGATSTLPAAIKQQRAGVIQQSSTQTKVTSLPVGGFANRVARRIRSADEEKKRLPARVAKYIAVDLQSHDATQQNEMNKQLFDVAVNENDHLKLASSLNWEHIVKRSPGLTSQISDLFPPSFNVRFFDFIGDRIGFENAATFNFAEGFSTYLKDASIPEDDFLYFNESGDLSETVKKYIPEGHNELSLLIAELFRVSTSLMYDPDTNKLSQWLINIVSQDRLQNAIEKFSEDKVRIHMLSAIIQSVAKSDTGNKNIDNLLIFAKRSVGAQLNAHLILQDNINKLQLQGDSNIDKNIKDAVDLIVKEARILAKNLLIKNPTANLYTIDEILALASVVAQLRDRDFLDTFGLSIMKVATHKDRNLYANFSKALFGLHKIVLDEVDTIEATEQAINSISPSVPVSPSNAPVSPVSEPLSPASISLSLSVSTSASMSPVASPISVVSVVSQSVTPSQLSPFARLGLPDVPVTVSPVSSDNVFKFEEVSPARSVSPGKPAQRFTFELTPSMRSDPEIPSPRVSVLDTPVHLPHGAGFFSPRNGLDSPMMGGYDSPVHRDKSKQPDPSAKRYNAGFNAVIEYIADTSEYVQHDRAIHDCMDVFSESRIAKYIQDHRDELDQSTIEKEKIQTIQNALEQLAVPEEMPEIDDVKRISGLTHDEVKEHLPDRSAPDAQSPVIQVVIPHDSRLLAPGEYAINYVSRKNSTKAFSSFVEHRDDEDKYKIYAGKMPAMAQGEAPATLTVGKLKVPALEYMIEAQKMVQRYLSVKGSREPMPLKEHSNPQKAMLLEAIILVCDRNNIDYRFNDKSGKRLDQKYKNANQSDVRQVFAFLDREVGLMPTQRNIQALRKLVEALPGDTKKHPDVLEFMATVETGKIPSREVFKSLLNHTTAAEENFRPLIDRLANGRNSRR